MRIIAGIARGVHLDAPSETLDVRPTLERTREAIASAIEAHCAQDLSHAVMLDAFAATGAMGLELASRGARHVTLVENNPKIYRILSKNSQAVEKQLGAEQSLSAIKGSAQNLRPSHRYNLIFLDPPYKLDPDLSQQTLVNLARAGNIQKNALVIHERATSNNPLTLKKLSPIKQKKYASSYVDYYLWKGEEKS